ncbi:4-alpha-glucanotransferase [Arthrobacter sp. Hiyo4]|nr:4-alpha-glucanotransferase [Arthrobacter sp. Hiyo4]
MPAGNSPRDGAYVTYDHEALIGILALEAQRAGAVVIGEDLGTFEPWVRDYLAARGILGTSILWFENDGDSPLPPERYRTQALASVNTHDLPPTAGYLAGDHVALRSRLGLLERSEAEEREEHAATLEKMMGLLRERGLLPEGGGTSGATADVNHGSSGSEERTIVALHRLLAQTPSVLLGVALVDAVGERRVQNQPGTTEALYPNWQVPLGGPDGKPVFIDDLPGNPRFNALLGAVSESLGIPDDRPARTRAGRHRHAGQSGCHEVGNTSLVEAASRPGIRRFVLTSILTCDQTPTFRTSGTRS